MCGFKSRGSLVVRKLIRGTHRDAKCLAAVAVTGVSTETDPPIRTRVYDLVRKQSGRGHDAHARRGDRLLRRRPHSRRNPVVRAVICTDL